VLVLFVAAYWLLESWATYFGNYYHYPSDFWDMVPFFDWSTFSWVPAPNVDAACNTLISDDSGISLSVPLMEGSLTFAMMWTARLLAPRDLHYLWPFLTGIAMLALDLFLDPIVASSRQCWGGASLPGCQGIGFWHWYVHEGLGNWYFCIPLFNWMAWYAAPIFLVALVLLLMWARDFVSWIQGTTPPSGISAFLLDGVLRAILTLAFLVLFVLAPVHPGDNIVLEGLIMLVLVVGTIAAVIWYRASFTHTAALRWTLIAPQVAFHVFALVALLMSGTLAFFPLLLIGILLMALGTWYAVSPYWTP
jgi:hypothetical protein